MLLLLLLLSQSDGMGGVGDKGDCGYQILPQNGHRKSADNDLTLAQIRYKQDAAAIIANAEHFARHDGITSPYKDMAVVAVIESAQHIKEVA
jgi:hypothetical protein